MTSQNGQHVPMGAQEAGLTMQAEGGEMSDYRMPKQSSSMTRPRQQNNAYDSSPNPTNIMKKNNSQAALPPIQSKKNVEFQSEEENKNNPLAGAYRKLIPKATIKGLAGGSPVSGSAPILNRRGSKQSMVSSKK